MTRNRLIAPHSWGIDSWPADVWPHTAARARYVIRSNKDDLVRAGALSRVGRELVILGERYSRWLERRTAHVCEYDCPANRQADTAAAAGAA